MNMSIADGNLIRKQVRRGTEVAGSRCLTLTKRNLDVHIRERWWSIGPGEITASYLRNIEQTEISKKSLFNN